MSTSRLPDHEQRALDEMERALSRDRRLERRLRTFRPSRRPDLARLAAYRPRLLTVTFLLLVSIGLMVAGIVTSEPAVIWAFAGVWPAALFASFRLLCRLTEG
ncbi:DUF3040 domain-containing protein [Streptomyces griseorubiginosus]|uniref:DUF3040 domain-containing protein n=1 Tax=Streptomyces griseorubiginosus TaxID=67304 RepID=UPI001AD77EE9|nr:DUF3040 domain-containing protein [Streptomyces griseorubiginosus]MBO4260102.1 DUF3040 domain-containing protein [Streptomyces griseorubiginosus]